MASANIQLIGDGYLDPSKTTTKGWNNPPVKKVLGFWVAPKALAPHELLVGPVSFQITSVTSTMDKPIIFVVTVTVKNTGSNPHGFDLYMSYLT